MTGELFMKHFISDYFGKKDDFDGGYNVQCVDAAKRGMKRLGIKNPPATGTGWADGYWYNYNKIPELYNNFDKITGIKNIKVGDMLLWSAPHVGWYNGNNKVFSQNQDGKNDGYSLKDISIFKGFLGALRFKGFSEKQEVKTYKGIEYLARKVINGDFGNGADRKEKIYNFVQTHVNGYLEGKVVNENILPVVKDIISGKYGNGQDRKNSLYTQVQTKVNYILKGV